MVTQLGTWAACSPKEFHTVMASVETGLIQQCFAQLHEVVLLYGKNLISSHQSYTTFSDRLNLCVAG